MSAEAADATWWDDELLNRQRFGELVDPVLKRLRLAHERGRFPQSLLLIGPATLGRELAAVEAAALLTCPTGGLWCACSSCQRVRRGQHPDVSVLLPRGAGRLIKIDPVRDVVVEASGKPYEAARRVWIFDGVERGRFGPEAANAFLKTLEEPPEHAVFILLAANPTAVLSTILSRCQKLALPGPVVLAAALGDGQVPPEIAPAALAEPAVPERLDALRSVIAAALAGELLTVLQGTHCLGDEPDALELAAAAALDLAAAEEDGDRADRLVSLAAQLLAVDGRSRALNLSRQRQLLACLLGAA